MIHATAHRAWRPRCWPRWLVVALLFALAGTMLTGAEGKPPDPGPFIENNIGLTVRPLTLDALCARLRARVTGSRDTPNLHAPSKTDRIVVVSARGVEVEAYVAAGSPIVIDRIAVSAGGPALPMPLRIGVSTPDEVRRVLGRDAENAAGPGGARALRYFDFERTANVLLWFDDHRHLAGVEWKFDAD